MRRAQTLELNCSRFSQPINFGKTSDIRYILMLIAANCWLVISSPTQPAFNLVTWDFVFLQITRPITPHQCWAAVKNTAFKPAQTTCTSGAIIFLSIKATIWHQHHSISNTIFVDSQPAALYFCCNFTWISQVLLVDYRNWLWYSLHCSVWWCYLVQQE